MTAQAIPRALCAFHIRPSGEAKEVAVSGLDLTTASKNGYHWLYFDLNTPEFKTWAAQMLPMTVAKVLVPSETRPRTAAINELVDGKVWSLDAASAAMLRKPPTERCESWKSWTQPLIA